MPGSLGTETNSPTIDAGTNALIANTAPGAAYSESPGTLPNSDISAAEGMKIQNEAATWKGTPYALVGEASKKGADGGGDCSGSTAAIYKGAGFPYEMRSTGTFRAYAASSGRFREVNVASEAMQAGDLLSWSSHIAIHAVFESGDPDATTDRTNANGKGHFVQVNDMWTATKPTGPPYMAHKQSWFRPDAPKVYRYQRVPHPTAP